MKPAQPHTLLDVIIERYLQRQRSLGRGYANEERILNSLHTFLRKAGSADLDQKTFQEWCKSHAGLTANVRRQRQRIARKFCLYRQRTEPYCFVPDPSHFPRRCPHVLPVIFGSAEVARMMAAANALTPTAGSPLRPAVACGHNRPIKCGCVVRAGRPEYVRFGHKRQPSFANSPSVLQAIKQVTHGCLLTVVVPN